MFSLAEIIKATAGTLVSGNPQAGVTGVSTDSRTISPGALFIALRGERFDGHDFAATAGGGPDVCVVVERCWLQEQAQTIPATVGVIAVEDTLQALQQLAIFHRQRCRMPVIGVTGSNGKSTTKEMIAGLLSTQRRVLKSRNSFNNHIGVPLSILDIRPEHEAVVLELGMNHAGEIRRLAQIARPDVSVITNVAAAHRGFFDSLADIAAAKCEILEQMRPDQVAVVNADVPVLVTASRKFSVRLVTFGLEQPALVTATDIRLGSEGVSFRVNGTLAIQMPLLGRHNVANALAAIAVARQYGIADVQIQQALAHMKPLAMRLEQHIIRGVLVIADCYNANPGSVAAAIDVLANWNTSGRRILCLADMRELGSHSALAHERIGALAASLKIDVLVAVGDEAMVSAGAAREGGMSRENIHTCATAEQAGQVLARLTRSGDTVLLKGSRSMHLEETLRLLGADAAAAAAP